MRVDDVTTCVFKGCDRKSDDLPVTFNKAILGLCKEHHADFDVNPQEWNGELSEDEAEVIRLWKREGIGQAS